MFKVAVKPLELCATCRTQCSLFPDLGGVHTECWGGLMLFDVVDVALSDSFVVSVLAGVTSCGSAWSIAAAGQCRTSTTVSCFLIDRAPSSFGEQMLKNQVPCCTHC